jgi:hypothetical protein
MLLLLAAGSFIAPIVWGVGARQAVCRSNS